MNQQSRNSTQWFRANGFNTGLTSIRRKGSRKVDYNQIEGDLAHCSVFDMNNNVLLLDEAVINGGTYKLLRYGEVIFLDQGNTKSNKLGCVVRIVVDSILPDAECGPNDHRKDASPFNTLQNSF